MTGTDGPLYQDTISSAVSAALEPTVANTKKRNMRSFLIVCFPRVAAPYRISSFAAVGFPFYPPAPELSAWYQKEKALKKQGVAKQQRRPKPAPNPH